MTEQKKLQALRSRFTVDVNRSTKDQVVVTLSNSQKYTADTLDEALDKCLMSILSNCYKNDESVKNDCKKGK